MALPVSRQFRIIALPLISRTATSEALTYYHFISPPLKGTKKPTLLARAQNKASEMWAGFGKSSGGWKLKVFRYGEKLVDRVDFEELSLSSLDPTLGPKISKFGKPEVQPDKKSGDVKGLIPIPLMHPTFHILPTPIAQSPVDHLKYLLEHRKPRHRRGMWTWAAIAPLTAPFMLIPVIPNLPFFFCVWRAWSHWKALKASEYLSSLIERGAIQAHAQKELDFIYNRYKSSHQEAFALSKYSSSNDRTRFVTSTKGRKVEPSATAAKAPPQLLLSREAVPDILKLFALPEAAGKDIYRAIEQARSRSIQLK